jgi:hypothetical protein
VLLEETRGVHAAVVEKHPGTGKTWRAPRNGRSSRGHVVPRASIARACPPPPPPERGLTEVWMAVEPSAPAKVQTVPPPNEFVGLVGCKKTPSASAGGAWGKRGSARRREKA